VATLIDPARAGEDCTLQGERQGSIRLLQDVAFGHKICIAEVTLVTSELLNVRETAVSRFERSL
jgi:hypothetical protein